MLASMIDLIKSGAISGKMAKDVFEQMFESGDDPHKIAEASGPQISDESAIRRSSSR